jgi:hypothetical protein
MHLYIHTYSYGGVPRTHPQPFAILWNIYIYTEIYIFLYIYIYLRRERAIYINIHTYMHLFRCQRIVFFCLFLFLFLFLFLSRSLALALLYLSIFLYIHKYTCGPISASHGRASTSTLLFRQHTSAYVSIRQHTSDLYRRPTGALQQALYYSVLSVALLLRSAPGSEFASVFWASAGTLVFLLSVALLLRSAPGSHFASSRVCVSILSVSVVWVLLYQ